MCTLMLLCCFCVSTSSIKKFSRDVQPNKEQPMYILAHGDAVVDADEHDHCRLV